jgi:hypothetical protein
MDISKLTETELKALGYDLAVQLQRIQNNLRLIEARLLEIQKPKEEVSADS